MGLCRGSRQFDTHKLPTMKQKLFFLYLLMLVALFISIIAGIRQNGELQRLRKNQHILLSPSPMQSYRMADGKSVATTEALTLKISELRNAKDSLLQLTQKLRVKNRRLLHLAQTTSHTDATITTIVRDSIVYVEPSPDTLRCLSYTDPWIAVDGCIKEDTFSGHFSSLDTLDLIVHRVPRRFLFFRYGCKGIQLNIVSHNPYSTITHARYIQLKKK